MDLVVDHVFETLVVCWTKVNLRLQLATGVAVVHDLESTGLVALFPKDLGDRIDSEVGEWRSVTLVSDDGGHLREQTLDQVTDGHTGGNGVRVDNEVRRDTFRGEGHILLTIGDTDRTLLTVTRSELVSNLRDTSRPHTNLDELLTFRIRRDEHLVDNAALCALEWRGHIALRVRTSPLAELLAVWWDRRRLTDDDIFAVDTSTGRNETVVFELVVRAMLHPKGSVSGRLLELLQLLHPAFLFQIHVTR